MRDSFENSTIFGQDNWPERPTEELKILIDLSVLVSFETRGLREKLQKFGLGTKAFNHGTFSLPGSWLN